MEGDCESSASATKGESTVGEVDTDAFTKLLSEEERKKKLLYVCALSTTCDGGIWSVIDPRNLSAADAGGNGISTTPMEATALSSYPTSMLDIVQYGCTVWNSKIYFAGGHKYHDARILSRQVFVFDTVSNIWLNPEDDPVPPSLQTERAFPRLVAFENHLYAFGHEAHSSGASIPPEHWAEVCHMGPGGSRQWHYLPHPPPKNLVELTSLIDSHVLYHLQNKVFFWVRSVGVGSYDFYTNQWGFVADPIHHVARCWSTSVALIEHFFFWHFCQTIYAYDFTTHTSAELCSLGSEDFDNDYFYLDGSYSSRSFVVHSGGNELCILWLQREEGLIHCKTFKIGFSSDSGALTLVLDATKSFRATGFALQAVLQV